MDCLIAPLAIRLYCYAGVIVNGYNKYNLYTENSPHIDVLMLSRLYH